MCASQGGALVARLEVIGPSVHDVIPLEGGSLSVGKGAGVDLVVSFDPAVSRVHLVLDRIGGAWFVRDLGARNGTFVNHTRVIGERALRDGDEVRLGSTRLILRDTHKHTEPTTATLAPPPHLTDRERDVLIELCRPVLQGSAFT
jgi:pSer/pThr/pTyr-binding forkhead associated (FHA) protein